MYCLSKGLNINFSLFLFLGLGGFLTETRFVSCVRIDPEPLYVPIASEANTVDPGSGVTPGGTAVTLTVLVPLLTLTAGAGLELGSLKKKFATISPQLSETNFCSGNFCYCTTTLTNNFTSFENISIIFFHICKTTPKLINLDVGEYDCPGPGLERSYGST